MGNCGCVLDVAAEAEVIATPKTELKVALEDGVHSQSSQSDVNDDAETSAGGSDGTASAHGSCEILEPMPTLLLSSSIDSPRSLATARSASTDFNGTWICSRVEGAWEDFLRERGTPWAMRKVAKGLDYGVGKQMQTIVQRGDELEIVNYTATCPPREDKCTIKADGSEHEVFDPDGLHYMQRTQWDGKVLRSEQVNCEGQPPVILQRFMQGKTFDNAIIAIPVGAQAIVAGLGWLGLLPLVKWIFGRFSHSAGSPKPCGCDPRGFHEEARKPAAAHCEEQASCAEEDELDLRWLEARSRHAERVAAVPSFDEAQALRRLPSADICVRELVLLLHQCIQCDSRERSERSESEQGERWLEEFAELRCEFRRRSRRLEKLENKMHAVTSSCIEAQHHLASLTRERDLLMDCVQELLLLTASDMQDPAQRQCAPSKAREAWQSKDGDISEPVAKDVAAGGARATPRSVRNSVSPRDLLKAPEGARRVRFDDKLQDLEKTRAQEKEQLGTAATRKTVLMNVGPTHRKNLQAQRFIALALERNPILKHRPTSAAGLPRHDTDVQAGGASAVDARTSDVEPDAACADEEAQAVVQQGGSDESESDPQIRVQTKRGRRQQSAEIRHPANLEDEEALRQLFQSAAAGSNGLRKKEFAVLCQSLLHIDLEYRELERIFELVVTSEGRQVMTEDHFVKTVQRRFFLRGIRRVVQLPDAQHPSLPRNFSLDMDTAANHRSDSDPFVGPYAKIRETRDHVYHGRYTVERQNWQDSVIDTVVQRTVEQARPRMVFTCGAMGVGKGYALAWMSQKGIFPLEDIVHIDPDHFKQVMPEWSAFLEYGRERGDPDIPGNRCHRESCYMQELALEESMRRSQHIWVDGSLRNAEWFVKVFSDIRLRYPAYQIAIFKVTAPEEVIRKRVAERAKQTGRSIPESMLVASIGAVERSVLMLTPHADFLASIDNSESTPKLQYFAAVDRSGDWQRIATRFAHILPATDAFPKKLSPFFVSQLACCPKLQLREPLKCRTDGVNRCQKGILIMRGLNIDVKLSPSIRVTLDPETRRVANIHKDAVAVAYLHPLSQVSEVEMAKLSYAERQVLNLGAFANFNLEDQLVALNSVASTTQQRQPALLEFGSAYPVSEEEAKSLPDNRWAPLTLQHMREAGGQRFAFLTPLEKLASRRVSATTPSSTTTLDDASGGMASRSPSYKVDHIGRTVKSTKLRHAWTLYLCEAEVKVELEHSRLTGKKKVLVDGKLLFSTTDKNLHWCWEHPVSKARITLNSENGKHVLRCEEPEIAKDAIEGDSDRSPAVEFSSFEPETYVTEPVLEEASMQGEEAADNELFSSGYSDSPVRQNLASKYATCENDMQDYDAEIAEEAKPSVPSYLVTRPQRKSALQEISAETARLNALLGVKDAQIAALQDELRRCAVGREASGPIEAVPTVEMEVTVPVPISPIQQLEDPSASPSPQLPPPQLVASVASEHFLVAELPSTPIHYPKAKPAVNPLDLEELDVTHRRGPAVAHHAPALGAQACAQGPCMTPPQPSPLLVQRYVSTPRRCAGPVQGDAAAAEQRCAEGARGRAGSMPPVHWASPGPAWQEPNARSSGRHGRSSAPPQNARSVSVQPQPCWSQRSRTPGRATRSITPRRDARQTQVQAQAPVFQMPPTRGVPAVPALQGCPPPWQLLPHWAQGTAPGPGLRPGALLPPVLLGPQVQGPLAGNVPVMAHPSVVQGVQRCRLNQVGAMAGIAPDLRLMPQPRPVQL
ncbi:unnamed protein product [Symbiodinium sp. KB8]|nr:unnamed protein product [Symbiodinium sp. KB8]